tara:strand:+ start:1996 stop:2298 length:303 start_codon:yes stop_codon:yes gene_type:complete
MSHKGPRNYSQGFGVHGRTVKKRKSPNITTQQSQVTPIDSKDSIVNFGNSRKNGFVSNVRTRWWKSRTGYYKGNTPVKNKNKLSLDDSHWEKVIKSNKYS